MLNTKYGVYLYQQLRKRLRKYKQVMNISTTVFHKIKKDLAFRLGLALALGISERQVQNLVKSAEKGASVRLRDHLAVEYYRKQGLTDSQIFEEDKQETTDAK